MLKLIQTEFWKLRRKSLFWLMLLTALLMPFFAVIYFRSFGKTDLDPLLFYKWSAFGYTVFMILPFILGIVCTILMHEENQAHVLKQLWIIPIPKTACFFSKFFIVLMYSFCFMLITAAASVLFGIASGCAPFQWESILFLLKKCLEIAVLSACSILPILAAAVSQKGYALPVCIILLYIFFGFFILPVNLYVHPIASLSAILAREGKIPGLTLTQTSSVPWALLCIGIWGTASVFFATISLKRKG